jgi:hypothetical protein
MKAHMITTQARVEGRGRMKIGPRSVAALVLTALACAGLAAAAFAGVHKYDTELTGTYEGGGRAYWGKVKSKPMKCERGRLVVLSRCGPGRIARSALTEATGTATGQWTSAAGDASMPR